MHGAIISSQVGSHRILSGCWRGHVSVLASCADRQLRDPVRASVFMLAHSRTYVSLYCLPLQADVFLLDTLMYCATPLQSSPPDSWTCCTCNACFLSYQMSLSCLLSAMLAVMRKVKIPAMKLATVLEELTCPEDSVYEM